MKKPCKFCGYDKPFYNNLCQHCFYVSPWRWFYRAFARSWREKTDCYVVHVNPCEGECTKK